MKKTRKYSFTKMGRKIKQIKHYLLKIFVKNEMYYGGNILNIINKYGTFDLEDCGTNAVSFDFYDKNNNHLCAILEEDEMKKIIENGGKIKLKHQTSLDGCKKVLSITFGYQYHFKEEDKPYNYLFFVTEDYTTKVILKDYEYKCLMTYLKWNCDMEVSNEEKQFFFKHANDIFNLCC